MNTSVDRVDGYDVTVTETRNGEAKGTETGSGGKMGWGLLIGFSLGLLLGFLIDNVAAGIGFGTGKRIACPPLVLAIAPLLDFAVHRRLSIGSNVESPACSEEKPYSAHWLSSPLEPAATRQPTTIACRRPACCR